MKNFLGILLGGALLTSAANAGTVFAEPFDSAAADVTINAQSDTLATFVDYSNFSVFGTAFSIPEAPRPIPGGAATRGVLAQANFSAGVAAGLNIVAGATPINFTGDYTVSFDAYMNLSTDPFPAGSTEQLLWGVGTDSADPIEARNNRGGGAAGTWGWLANENGYGTEDAAINEGDVELADLGDTQTGEGAPFDAAFDNLLGGPHAAPALQWVRVDIEVAGGIVNVLFNDVLFFSEASASTDGFALLGYEDPFSSVSDQPDHQWALFDNFTVVPEPTSLSLLLVSLGLLGRRR